MAGATFDLEMKKDDTFPTFKFQIVRESDGQPIDVQGETVNFFIKKPSAAPGAAFVAGGGTVTVLDNKGNCSYAWDAADTDTAGILEGEGRFTKDSKVGTVPGNRFFRVRIHDH